MKGLAAVHYAWRGWLLGLLFATLAWARHQSRAELHFEGLILIGLGLGWRLYAARFIQGHSNGSRLSAGPLAVAGPYALSRHPLYLANMVTAAGLVLFAHCLPYYGVAIFFTLIFLQHHFLAQAEERFLIDAHGEVYLGYMRVTPRWIGRPKNIRVFSEGRERQGTMPDGQAGQSEQVGQSERDALGAALLRQSGNLAKTLVCVAILWALT